MSDREFLNGLATFMEAAPSMGTSRKAFANRIRAIASRLPEEQDTDEVEAVTVRTRMAEPVYTTGLPSGVFIFSGPSPTLDSAPVIMGAAIAGRFYGDTSKAHWVHVPGADAEDMDRLGNDIKRGNIDMPTVIPELRQYRRMAQRA